MYTDQVKHVTEIVQQMFTSFHRVTVQNCGRSETKPVIDAQLSAPHDILEMIFLTIELSYQIMRGRFPSPISYTPKLNVDDVQFKKIFIFEKTFLNPYVDNAINNENNVQLYGLLYVNCTSLWRKITMIFEERHKEFAVKCFARFMTISAIVDAFKEEFHDDIPKPAPVQQNQNLEQYHQEIEKHKRAIKGKLYQQLRKYNITHKDFPQKWLQLFNQTRQEFLNCYLTRVYYTFLNISIQVQND